MQKLIPLLQTIAAIVAKLNPVPFLDSVEAEYGRTVKLIVITVVVIVAVAAWAVDYFTSGAGAGFPWAPVLVASVPVLLKLLAPGGEPQAQASQDVSFGLEPVAQKRSYVDKVLWG